MADFPSGIYSPRTKENKAGVEYVESEKTTLFAEDITKDDAEIVAIETELGTNPKGTYISVKANLVALWNAIVEKCTGAEINTGTDDTKFATPKAIADSDLAKTSEIPDKATGAEIDTGEDDAKFVTPKAVEDSDIAKVSDIPSVPVKATGAEIDTGEDDAKFATPKAIEDSKLSYTDREETLKFKRIDCRTYSIGSSATLTPNGDATDVFIVLALAVGTTFAAPTGTPVDGQKLIIRIKDNATAQTLAWNAIYRASSDLALPTTTVISKTMYLGFIYNSADSKWDLVAFLDNI